MNKLLPILLVIMFSLFPELLLGYDDRDPWEGYGRGSGSGSSGAFGIIFILFAVLFWAVVIWGLINYMSEHGNTSEWVSLIGFILFAIFALNYLTS